MKTSLMSESLVVSSDVEETVTEVLTQFAQDGGQQAGMSLESLQQKVEFTLEYSEGSLSKWKNRLRSRLRDFFKSNNPKSVVPKHRPHDGIVWNDTGNPILKDHDSVTRYD
jgi:hypothetical protein